MYFLIFLLLFLSRNQTLELGAELEALSEYAQRRNDSAGSLVPEQTVLMILLLWVFPSLPHVHFLLTNVLGPRGKAHDALW